MWHWDPVTTLVVAGVVFVAANAVLVGIWLGARRALERLHRDLASAEDPFSLAVLLALARGRHAQRTLDRATAFRRRADARPYAKILPDPVERSLTRWIRKRIPGWSRRSGARLWTVVLVTTTLVSWVCFFAAVFVVVSHVGGPDPEWGRESGGLSYMIWFAIGSPTMVFLQTRLGMAIEELWDQNVLKPCDRIVRRELAGAYDTFAADLTGTHNDVAPREDPLDDVLHG